MTDDAQDGQAARQAGPEGDGVPEEQRKRRWPLWLFLGAILIVLAVFLVPPLVGIGRYKSRITQMVSASFGRPVRLSSVELRLLPRPGFVLTDLSVADDPEYGAEPVLHANTVRANIRLLSLWRGRLEIGSVSVDEASLNVVRAGAGRCNLDPLLRSAAKAAPAGDGARKRFPYLKATNSRINFKNGAEKLPFSIVDTDLEFWEENPGDWRVSLRGQPVRTDVVLDMADTGIVRLEATAHSAPVLSHMPLRVDLDWRDAQLGQLSRLLVGSDADWRGDLTGNLHLEGTADAANVTARLRAEGVHRAEFAPAAPLDFDANCSLVYHYSRRALENLVCDSPLGDGHMRLTGSMPGANAAPSASLELDRIPVGAGLDMLRTMRSGIDSDLEAAGTISGKLAYSGNAQTVVPQTTTPKTARTVHGHAGRAVPIVETQGPLTGSFTVDGFALSGGGLDQPLRAPKFTLEPIENEQGDRNGVTTGEGIAGTMTIPAGGDAPLAVNLRLALYGYEAIVHGQASIARARQIAKLAGTPDAAALDGLAGDPITANLTVEGPWVPNEVNAAASVPAAATAPVAVNSPSVSQVAGNRKQNAPGPVLTDFDRGMKPLVDSISGTVVLHNANWRADYLASHVQIANATLHLDENAMRWDPVEFSYGPVKGSLKITALANCPTPENPESAAAKDKCAPRFEAQFGALDAEVLQAAFLGARKKGTLLSDLIDQLHTTSITPWPVMSGTIRAESLVLGPVTLQQPSANVKISAASADFSGLTAGTLGGQVSASGTVSWAAGDQAAPKYSISAQFAGLSGAAAGQLLAARWTGGPMNVDGKLELSGFSAKDLAASAKGTLDFEWKHGGVSGQGTASAVKAKADSAQAMPTRFDSWSGDATIGSGAITFGDNHLIAGGRKLGVQGAITFATPAKVDLSATPESEQKSR